MTIVGVRNLPITFAMTLARGETNARAGHLDRRFELCLAVRADFKSVAA
jgi:hypothetical protein